MSRGRQIAGWTLLVLSLLLLAAAAWLYWGEGRPFPFGPDAPTVSPTPTDSPVPTPWPTFTPYVPVTETTAGLTLRVTCNAPATVWLTEYWSERETATGRCTTNEPLVWTDLPRATYYLHAYNYGLDMETQRQVRLNEAEKEVELLFPGVLLVQPSPEQATVLVGGRTFGGQARLTYPAKQCPLTVTVVVDAPGYLSATHHLQVQAGLVNRYPLELEPLPTPTPGPTTPASPAPTTVAQPTSPPPSPPPEWSQEQLQALMYEMWQNFNQVRQQHGLPTVDYDESLQVQANEAAWQFYVTNRGISKEELDAIVAPGWWVYVSNNVPLAGGTCGIPADYNPTWNPNFVVSYAQTVPAEVKAITYGFYGTYTGHCGIPSVTIAMVARY